MAIIPHIFKETLQKLWHAGDFWLYFYANTRKHENSVESCKNSLLKTLQWLPTGFRVKSELLPLDLQGSAGRAPTAIFMFFHNTLLLVGYAPATMDILFVPRMCQGHFLHMVFAFCLPPGILHLTLHPVSSLISYWSWSYKIVFLYHTILKSHCHSLAHLLVLFIKLISI